MVTKKFKQYILMVFAFAVLGGAVYSYQMYNKFSEISVALASGKVKHVYWNPTNLVGDGYFTSYRKLGNHGVAKQAQRVAHSNLIYSIALFTVGSILLLVFIFI